MSAQLQTRSVWGRLDLPLILIVSILLAVGLVMVASASVAVADRAWNNPEHLFDRQLIYAGVGIVAGAIILKLPLALYQRLSFVVLGGSLLLLILVLIPGLGVSVNGAQRWLDLGVVRLQVSEFARLGLFIYVAAYAVRHQEALLRGGMGLLRPLLPVFLAAGLLLVEPDFGAAVVLVAVVMSFLFVAGAPALHCALLVLIAVVGLGAIAVLEPYRVERLLSFRDPWSQAFDGGFQLTQSLIAIGRGQLFGEGLGNSVQKLLYLPETHTDFIFAIFAEEFGLAGVLLLLLGFGLLLRAGWRIAQAAYAAGHDFAGHLCVLLSFWLVLQAGLNMAVNLGLLPTKGLPLPFFSYGGSHLLACLLAIALMLRAGLETADLDSEAEA